jgi:RNA polymerase primary sigma factor
MKKNTKLSKRSPIRNGKTVLVGHRSHEGGAGIFDDSYESYMSHIIHYPRLTPKREAELSRIVRKSRNQKNVDAAISEFVEGNLLLVVKCAIEHYKRFLHRSSSSMTLMDMITEGNYGLLRAAKLYNSDHKAHAKFGTYAIMSIRQSIRTAVKHDVTIHVPMNHYAYWPALNKLREQYGSDIPEEILAETLGINVETARLIRAAKYAQPARLDANPSWENVVADGKSADGEVNVRMLGGYLVEVMDEVLTPREKRVMCDLYLNGADPTYDQIGERERVSRERIRQICVLAMRKMRRRIVADWEKTNRLKGTKVPICLEVFLARDYRSTRQLIERNKSLDRGDDFDRRDKELLSNLID